MRFKLYLAVVFLVAGTCAGQTFFPRKDLTFGQVAVGVSIRTEITATNRGVHSYEGTLFFRKGEGEIWNPIVDGVIVSGGKRKIQLEPGQTKTFDIQAPGGVVLQSGTVMLLSHDLVLDNFIEGNLTYFFFNDSGKVFDSVGLGSSGEFYQATIPFENFANIGLALVNGNVSLVGPEDDLDIEGRPNSNANVVLHLFRDTGEFVASSNDDFLTGMVPLSHTPKLLPDFFAPGIQLGRGKVEITSDIPIYGTALTFLFVESGTQSSSLPLEPSPVSYAITMSSESDDVLSGELALWAEGYFVKGYMIIYSVNESNVEEPVLTLVNGQLIDGILELSFYAQGEAFQILDDEVSLVLEILGGFGFEGTPPGGGWVMTSLFDPGSTLAGSFTLNKVE